MVKSAKAKVLSALSNSPLRTGDLIEACGYNSAITFFDNAIGIQSRQGFNGSPEQRALAKLVESGEVFWRRDAKMDVWYKLPGQRFPAVKGEKHAKFSQLARSIYKLLGDVLERECLLELGKEDVWHEFESSCDRGCSVTLQEEEDGWHLLDGDPICNWCFNTFDKRYPFDTSPEKIARRIKRELTITQPKLCRDDEKKYEVESDHVPDRSESPPPGQR